jgi:hypothetical protein
MTTVELEMATRVVPWAAEEFGWARVRPPADRVPLPVVGGRVFFRFDRFGDVHPAVVVEVPDLARGWRWTDLEPGEDTPDAWVWQLIRDNATGAPVLDALGLPKVELLPDPQPVIVCRVEGRAGLHATREARLRGSAGWLPLDWRERWRPGPHHGWTEETIRNLMPPQPRRLAVTAEGELV